MSLSGVIGNALSGLNASQMGLQVSSNNIANVNTPGYARSVVNLQTRSMGGAALGVDVAGVTRIADQFLQAAHLGAVSDAGMFTTVSTSLDRLQSSMGGLDDAGSMFSRLNTVFDSFSEASVDPSLSVTRLSAASNIQSFLDEASRISQTIESQRFEADAQISATVTRANVILNEIFHLNSSVQSLSSNGGDTTGPTNRQAELLDELAGFMDISTDYQQDGRVIVRTGDGVLLVDNYVAEMNYVPAGSGTFGMNYGTINAVLPNGASTELDGHIVSGELRGLLDLRDTELTQIGLELAELTAGAADALNRIHNDAAAYPAPQTLEGRNTGLEGTDLHNFTGATTLAVTGSNGSLVSRIDIDFDAGTLSVDGGAAQALGNTVDSLTTAINGALGANGSASFTNGALTLSAANATDGVALIQDEANPSARGGRGFSHFLGLNDLVDSTRPGFFETGMSGADTHGFTAGTLLGFEIAGPNGGSTREISVTMNAGETFNDVLTALNDPVNGVGRYVTFSLDGNGTLQQTPNVGYEGYSVDLTSDSTNRANSGISFSELFGVGLSAQAGRAQIFEVNTLIRNDSSLLSLGKLDLDAATVAGDFVLNSGDNRGAVEMQDAFSSVRDFNAAGTLSATQTSLENYAARFAGSVGARAAQAVSEAGSAEVLRDTAMQKRLDVEGVNLDEELAAMTFYQQSYNASARMLQAANEMTDILMNIV
ncbi:flagellar hook-associated protein FlgK [Maricaulis sp. D1M11]|uniref:flagellar hook-associated protein FlgK n=1 Tax=Maricaulis sp. D1M11 TaxID=3076117 RepID=UPI0039B5F938